MESRRRSDRLIRQPWERGLAGGAWGRLLRWALALAGSAWIVCGVGVAQAAAPTPPRRGSYAWSKFAHYADNSGTSSDPGVSVVDAPSLGVRWMAPLGATALSSPVAAWNRRLGRMLVYIGTESGDFMALDAGTGDTVWSVDLGKRILSTPLVEGGSVWVARANSPVLYKLNAATGAVRCSRRLAGSPDGSLTDATLARGAHVIYASALDNGTTSGPVYAVKGSDCAVDWRFSAFNAPATGSWDPLSFATDGQGRALLLFGTNDPDDSVYALNAATGAKVWSFKTPSLADNSDTDVGAGVTVSPPGRNGFADGVAYVPAEDGWLFALDLATGRRLWSYDFGAQLPLDHRSRSTAALVGRRLIFGEGGGVMAVNAVTGLPDWTFATGDVESISAPAVVGPAGGQVVAVTTLAGAFDLLSVASGRLLYQYQTPSYSTSSFADVDGNLVTADADGFLYDLAPRGGNGAAPSTAVTSPRRGSTVVSRTGRLTIRGTAAGTSISRVEVAIQSGGPGRTVVGPADRQMDPRLHHESGDHDEPACGIDLVVSETPGTGGRRKPPRPRRRRPVQWDRRCLRSLAVAWDGRRDLHRRQQATEDDVDRRRLAVGSPRHGRHAHGHEIYPRRESRHQARRRRRRLGSRHWHRPSAAHGGPDPRVRGLRASRRVRHRHQVATLRGRDHRNIQRMGAGRP